MEHYSRRKFLQTSTVLLTTGFVAYSFTAKENKPLLSFSTLGCPDWDFDKILEFARHNNYQGIELRGLRRELDLTKCDEFSSPQHITDTLGKMNERNLQFAALGSSANLHFADPALRNKNLDEAKQFIDLAEKINCPYVRVFPNKFPKEQDKNTTMELISSGLLHLANHAKGSRVKVLMETHGDVVLSADIEKIMQSAQHTHTGLVWDVANMWTITRESPAAVYKKLKKYILHTHIKDALVRDGMIEYKLLGAGEVPIFEAIDALSTSNYKGFYSFEWEKLWHPEIAGPEIALADYPVVMRRHFKIKG